MKVFLFVIVFVLVLLILYFAFMELKGSGLHESSYRVPLSTTYMITSYLNEELASHIKDSLSRLISEFRPSRAIIGETDNPEGEVVAPFPLKKAFILYKTTSLDFAGSVLNQIKEYLNSRGIIVEERGFSHVPESRYHYIYVAFA